MSASSLILASQSPRRRDLLEAAGYSVICHPPGVEELSGDALPRELTAINAKNKAMEIAPKFPGDVVLGADTVVVFRGEIFGKPSDHCHAREMLKKLSGNVHEVITAVCLMKFDGMRICQFEEFTKVKFRNLADSDIEAYIDSIHPLDKAGAYAAQEDNGRIIECIEGSLTNVIGLPMERLKQAMEMHFPEITAP